VFAFIFPILVMHGFVDVSHMGEVGFRGPDIKKAVWSLVTHDVSQLETARGSPCSTSLGERSESRLPRCSSEKFPANTRMTRSLASDMDAAPQYELC
jgi:hypothetical protein